MKSTFLAWIFRMPLIRRWSLMYSHKQENIAEHSHQVAVVAHMLAVIRNTVFDGKLSPEKAATLALYHEIAECWTSDVASPVKYSDPSLTREFKNSKWPLKKPASILCQRHCAIISNRFWYPRKQTRYTKILSKRQTSFALTLRHWTNYALITLSLPT